MVEAVATSIIKAVDERQKKSHFLIRLYGESSVKSERRDFCLEEVDDDINCHS